MSEGAAPEGGGGKPGNIWSRRSRKAKIALIVLGVIIVLAVIGSFSSSSDEDNGSSSSSANNPPAQTSGGGGDDEAEEEEVKDEEESKTGPLVKGTWMGECNQFSSGDLEACQKLRVTKVTCQWIEDKVHMKATFKNGLNAHVTVHLEPRYRLKNAGEHGEGLTNFEDVGIDALATRTWEKDLDPAGVDGQPAITACTPTLEVLQGIELG
jgi:hypothetical protein